MRNLSTLLAVGVLALVGCGGGDDDSGGGDPQTFASDAAKAVEGSEGSRQEVEQAFQAQDPDRAVAALEAFVQDLQSDGDRIQALDAPAECADEKEALSEFIAFRADFYNQLLADAQASADPGSVLARGTRDAELRQRSIKFEALASQLDFSDSPCG